MLLHRLFGGFGKGSEIGKIPVAARRGRNQRLGIVLSGRAQHLSGRAIFDSPALLHHQHLVTDLCSDAQIVRDEQNTKAQTFLQLGQQVQRRS